MEILGRSEFGVLISKLTSQALASAVDGLLRDEALRTHYQKQGYRRAQEFDLAKIGPRYVALIQSILGGGGTRP
jgi:glycosyltransferase involved in cell wall biosynthesis